MTTANHSNPAPLAMAEQLLTSLLQCIREIQQLAPQFPDELHEARDPKNGMQVADFLERLARHSQQHQREIAAIRASIGAAWPTDPNDAHPVTGQPYANTWYQAYLLEALLRRAELVGELIGLTDAEFTAPPDPKHTAGNTRSVKDVCEHVLRAQGWQMDGIRTGIEAHRCQ